MPVHHDTQTDVPIRFQTVAGHHSNRAELGHHQGSTGTSPRLHIDTRWERRTIWRISDLLGETAADHLMT
jgi:hypothetical protein